MGDCGKIPSVESEKGSSGRASGGVGASTLEAHIVGGDPETAKKVRRSVETLGAASRDGSLKAHDTSRVGGKESQPLQRWEYVKKTIKRPRLQIIRGLPGSGKSTLALKEFPHLMRVETDMFFTRNGEYVFTMELNRKAVRWFNRTVKDFCKTGMDFVATGVFAGHTERLLETVMSAIDAGYDVYIKTMKTNYGTVHGVPKEHYDSMKRCFVPQSTLKKFYRMRPQVHFGMMPMV